MDNLAQKLLKCMKFQEKHGLLNEFTPNFINFFEKLADAEADESQQKKDFPDEWEEYGYHAGGLEAEQAYAALCLLRSVSGVE